MMMKSVRPSVSLSVRRQLVGRPTPGNVLKKLLMAFFVQSWQPCHTKYHYGPGFQNHPVTKMAFGLESQIWGQKVKWGQIFHFSMECMQILVDIFVKYWPIFKIFSPAHSVEMCNKFATKRYHHTLTMSLHCGHYLVCAFLGPTDQSYPRVTIGSCSLQMAKKGEHVWMDHLYTATQTSCPRHCSTLCLDVHLFTLIVFVVLSRSVCFWVSVSAFDHGCCWLVWNMQETTTCTL